MLGCRTSRVTLRPEAKLPTYAHMLDRGVHLGKACMSKLTRTAVVVTVEPQLEYKYATIQCICYLVIEVLERICCEHTYTSEIHKCVHIKQQ